MKQMPQNALAMMRHIIPNLAHKEIAKLAIGKGREDLEQIVNLLLVRTY